MKEFNVCLLPGDGIGCEVVNEAKKVLSAVEKKFGYKFNYKEELIGGIAYEKTGVYFAIRFEYPPVAMVFNFVFKVLSSSKIIPSTILAWPKTTPFKIASSVVLPITLLISDIWINGSLDVKTFKAFKEIFNPGHIKPPTKFPLISTTSNVVAVPKSTITKLFLYNFLP